MIPHVKRAMQLTLRLTGARIDYQAALDGLERTGTAIIVVDKGGVILSANSLAELLLRQGGSVRSANGRLVGVERKVAARLAALIQRAANAAACLPGGGAGGGVAIERDDGRGPMTVLVTPFRPRLAGLGVPFAAALVFIRDAAAAPKAADVLRDLFGLTPAQAGVAALVAEGKDPEHIAEALSISRFTVRDHLKIVFAKTGTSRQAQLVALITGTVAALGDGSSSGGRLAR